MGVQHPDIIVLDPVFSNFILCRVIAEHFDDKHGKVAGMTKVGASGESRLREDLQADKFDAEEIRIEFEDEMGVYVVSDFDGAATVADLFRIVAGSVIFSMKAA